MSNIKKILIANRGEIALRIQRAAEALGVATVTVYSDADKNALATRLAKESYRIGPAPATESYLKIESIIEAAKKTNCDALHPGYGFLSESAEFAQAVTDAGITFIGPTAESIRLLGSKTEARKIAEKIAIPLPPGTKGGLTDAELEREAAKVGFPLMIKAAAGGGGRGMRVVEKIESLKENLGLARSEAKKFFGDDTVFLERRILQPRHVEVQVFGDTHGEVIHFGTRDCSTQRRHQKLVEEAPAPGLAPALLDKIHEAAVRLAKEVGYRGAGTVEFLVSGDEFFFLEMNTRIQVEHPVTEEISGADLVSLQINVANGEKLPYKQSDIKLSGHSIEYRIYAEAPENDFAPSLGTITQFSYQESENLRLEAGYEAGDEITPYYDAMICKVIVSAKTRNEAIERSKESLSKLSIAGVTTNVSFHSWLIERTSYAEQPVTINYLEENFTSDTIPTYKRSKQKDPYHQPPVSEMEHTQQFRYVQQSSGESCLIELVHLKDGTFLAAPKSADGRYALEKYCRRSNGHQTALSSLKSEVLSEVPIAELFREL